MSLGAFIALGATMTDRTNILPITTDEVAKYVQTVQGNLVKTVNDLSAVPSHERNFNNTFKPWYRQASDLLASLGTLDYIGRSDLPGDEEAIKGLQSVITQVYQIQVLDPTLRTCLLDSAKNILAGSGSGSPYEYHHIQCLLEDGDKIKQALSPEELQTLDHLRTFNAPRHKEPFLTLRGLATPKTNETSGKTAISVLTLNTCFTPGMLSYVHGGVKPWNERIIPLTEKIRSTNADVVCLQEVFAEDASHALYEALKDDYAYFYGSIGPRPLGFSPERIGQSSGLFVASKYAIESPQFTQYTAALVPMNFGFFDFIVKDGSRSLAHVYTTHMQALHAEGASQVRGQQIQQFIDRMTADAAASPQLPHFMCGDLNIAWGSGEPGEALIRAHFHDAYNHNRTDLEPSQTTWTEYFTKHFFDSHAIPIAVVDESGILDYALLLKSPAGHETHTTLIRTSERDAPDEVISDHHGLLTSITGNP